MEPFTSLWWYTWIVVDKPLVANSVVYKPLVAAGVFYKPLVACVDRCSQALGGRMSHLQAFGGVRGSSFASHWWLTWIAVHKHLVADGVNYKPFGGVRGSSCISLRWHT